MKKLNILLLTIILLMATSFDFFSQNTNPIVTDVEFTYDAGNVTITYNLSDAEQTTVSVRLLVSEDSGDTWDNKTDEANGDVGETVACSAAPAQKTITWPYSGSNLSTMILQIIADDGIAGGSPCAGVDKVYYEGGPHNDGDGNGDYYTTIQIGDQCWLKENLNVGTRIDGANDQTNNGQIEKYCYDNDENNCNTYGGLYQWDEAMEHGTLESRQGICPDGWVIPTYEELQTLQNYVNNESVKMVNTDQTMTTTLTPTNTSGFSAIFSGWFYRDNSVFVYKTQRILIWSCTETSSTNASYMQLKYSEATLLFGSGRKTYGYSVRCIKDNSY